MALFSVSYNRSVPAHLVYVINDCRYIALKCFSIFESYSRINHLRKNSPCQLLSPVELYVPNNIIWAPVTLLTMVQFFNHFVHIHISLCFARFRIFCLVALLSMFCIRNQQSLFRFLTAALKLFTG